MINSLFSDPLSFVLWALALVIAITIHEFAHAWTAVRLGDPTPKLQGRLTLNPLSHLDPVGTIMLLFFRFGWGKPVQFDPYNLQNPRRDAAVISLAGPVSNLILATTLSLIVNLVYSPLTTLLIPIIYLNVVLAVFNLIPMHPLDGGKILVGLMPKEQAKDIDVFMNKYGMIILLFLIFPFFGSTSPIFSFLTPIINFILSVLLPSVGYI